MFIQKYQETNVLQWLDNVFPFQFFSSFLQINTCVNYASWLLKGQSQLKSCQLLLQAENFTSHLWLIKADKPWVMVLKLHKGISI